MTTLAIDIETYSTVDLKQCGRHNYVADPTFEIMLLAYSIDDQPTQIIDFMDLGGVPIELGLWLTDPTIVKTAYNAAFEKLCLDKWLLLNTGPWECTMIKGAMVSLPLGLDACARALKLTQQKDKTGKALIKYFSMPCKPSRVNGMRTRNLPYHDFEKWESYKRYCVQDVETEKAVRRKLEFFQIPATEKKLYTIDQIINDRGILVDYNFVNQAMEMDAQNRTELIAQAKDITGLANPNSVAQLLGWLHEGDMFEGVKDLTKETVAGLIDGSGDKVDSVLKIRQEISKASIKKYQAMADLRGPDDRVRGLLQFHGATRTGRWAGRMIQVQNLIKNNLPDLDQARQLVREGSADLVDLFYGSISMVLSQLIRTAFIPSPGYKFIASDFSAIEARVIAWYANERWRLEVFKTHGKIYEASGAAMFKVPIEQVKKGTVLRDKAKIAELALGYQGGSGALQRMGALQMGLKEDELAELVYAWRAANPNIVRLWNVIGNAVITVIENRCGAFVCGVKIYFKNNILYIKLPSGRLLCYLRPKILDGMYGPQVVYEGQKQGTGLWGNVPSYGGKFVENIVQATARDLLAEKLILLHDAGYKIVMHVHDEIVIEAPVDTDKKLVDDIMRAPVSWAEGLPLAADTTEGFYYKKD